MIDRSSVHIINDILSSKIFKILVVDDNVQNIQLLGNILKSAGFEVGFAIEGKQAISILQHSPDYDLLLLDIDMPVLNGIETCIMIREDSQLQDLPIIFLTAFTDNDKIIAGFQAGAQDYVTKPFNSSELLARVNTHLQLKNKTEQLRELNVTLERKVGERTNELQNANKKIARLDKAKSDFLILISHEMRTPLNGIVGLAELLKATFTEQSQSEYIDYLVLSAQKLLKFSDSALLITNLQLQNYDISREKHDPVALMEDILNYMEEKLQSKNMQIKRNYTTELLLIPFDYELIELSLKSILENAIIFSLEKNEIVVFIGKENEQLKISITDAGPGFSEEALAQSTEIFNSADIAHHSEGFGLSLATVKLIMDIHKGRISINSNKNGTEVSLYLPLI
jgi:two-component system, sensor histidine kinase and response regulator